jgi:hypothetical protein
VDSLIADVSKGQATSVADLDCSVDYETVNEFITDIDNCVTNVRACTPIDNCIHINNLSSHNFNNDNISLLDSEFVCNYATSSVVCDNSVNFVNDNDFELVITNADCSVDCDITFTTITGNCSEFVSYQGTSPHVKIFDLDTQCYYDRAFREFFNAFTKCDSHIFNIYTGLGWLCNVQGFNNTNYQSFLMYNFCKRYLSGLFSINNCFLHVNINSMLAHILSAITCDYRVLDILV